MDQRAGLVLLLCLPAAHGAKLLTVALMGGSHYFMMDEITKILASGGHNVSKFHQQVRSLIGVNISHNGYTYIPWTIGENYAREYGKVMQKFVQERFYKKYYFSSFLTILDAHAYECDKLLSDSEILAKLRNENYDLMVIDAFHFCTLLLAEKLKLPFVAVYGTSFYNARYVHLPSNPSYVPAFMSHLSDSMTFFERLQNVRVLLRGYFEGRACFDRFSHVIEKHFSAEENVNLEDLLHKAELWIYNTGFSLEYPRPLLPNMVYVGSFLSKPAEPLPQEMEEFLSGDQGFIVIALGTMVESISDLHLIGKMTKAFARLPQKFIWRYNNNSWPPSIPLPANVKTDKWLPQNDLLGHPQVRAFISHGGINSLHQAVYHGVPVLGLPLFYDQMDNIVRLESKGIALSISVSELEEETLVRKLTQLMTIPSFKQSARRASKQLRFQPFTAAELTSRWIDSILNIGSGDHLKPRSYRMPTYQLYLLDVWVFALTVTTLAIFCAHKILRSLSVRAMAGLPQVKTGEKKRKTM
uniref:UDP-glucuronosyltransferase 3A1-like isoform X1 n=2 Tax=Pristiophorus japonicus TaxID=55135 RepID=UPI00398E5D5C